MVELVVLPAADGRCDVSASKEDETIAAERAEQHARWLRPCGDSSCILLDRTSRGGQHTNGGCHHLKDAPHEWRRMIRVFAAEIIRLRRTEGRD